MDTNQNFIHPEEAILRVNEAWLYFANPHQVIQAEALEEVIPALREIEDLVQTNHWHAAGFVGYEAAPAFDKALRASSALLDQGSSLRSTRDMGFPLLWFGLYPPPRRMDLPEPAAAKPALTWLPTVDRDTYNAAIARIKEHIAEGQTYQVNYTMRLQASLSDWQSDIQPWDFFLHLAQTQNNHAAYIDTGRHVICSASPELFFELDGEALTSRPMKGTAPRGRTTPEDREQAQWLKESEKNRAENVMIVDMVRNDMGRIAQIGSVHVPELFTVEKYPTLWQMTSTVQAKTTASLTQIFTALFPCASITGAPKVSTMRIISELETTPRRIYTGSIGYISSTRKATFNVAIRTALIDRDDQTAEYGVGGGIVWDSTSADEYAEALLKARVLIEAIPPFSLFETMLWTPAEGFFLREKHIARLLDSAEYFGLQIARRGGETPPLRSNEILDSYLDEIASQFTSPQRVRVLLNKNGELTSEARPIQPHDNPPPMKVRLARDPIQSGNVFLFHKTTHRDVYESARRSAWSETPQEQSPHPQSLSHGEREGYDDVLLYNERSELTEFTIGNLVVEMDGKLHTPPVSCGLLAGTFRAYLLETGQVDERIIQVDELKVCTNVFLVNSIRKWQPVEFIGFEDV